jgi:hypothetical protein
VSNITQTNAKPTIDDNYFEFIVMQFRLNLNFFVCALKSDLFARKNDNCNLHLGNLPLNDGGIVCGNDRPRLGMPQTPL